MTSKDSQNKLIRFSVSLSENLLLELDKQLTNQGYSSRSELVRDMIRDRLIEEQWEQDEMQVAVLVMIYNHHTRDLNQKMIDIQHNTKEIKILCTTHVHLNHHNCLEMMVLQGKSEEIYKMSLEIGGLKGVKYSKLTKAAFFDHNA